MIYTATYRQHITNIYTTVELLFFHEVSNWVVWASLTLLSLINVVVCCFIVMNYYQKISLKLNRGSFLSIMGHISNYSYCVGCSCIYCCCLVATPIYVLFPNVKSSPFLGVKIFNVLWLLEWAIAQIIQQNN